jgi:hypothetical protein
LIRSVLGQSARFANATTLGPAGRSGNRRPIGWASATAAWPPPLRGASLRTLTHTPDAPRSLCQCWVLGVPVAMPAGRRLHMLNRLHVDLQVGQSPPRLAGCHQLRLDPDSPHPTGRLDPELAYELATGMRAVALAQQSQQSGRANVMVTAVVTEYQPMRPMQVAHGARSGAFVMSPQRSNSSSASPSL